MPDLDRSIVLVGMMGAGKSRVGYDLARLMKLPFVDVDREIGKAAGMTPREIFERFGEAAFRDGERKVMRRLLDGRTSVIATGGGAFIQDDIRREVKERALSVWIRADLPTLLARVGRDLEKRPMLRGGDPAKKLQELMDLRYPVYAEADVTVMSANQTPREMARRILRAVEQHLARNKE